MNRLLVREGRCPATSIWYVCTKGPFQGCCSVDPCVSGVCPDGESNSMPSSTKSVTTKTTTTTSAVETKVTVTLVTSIQHSTLPTSSISLETNTAQPNSSPSSISTNSWGHGHTQLIGGVVGATIAVLLLGVLLAYLVYRARKKHNGRFTLLCWKHVQPRRDPSSQRAVDANNTTDPPQANIHPCFRTEPRISTGPEYHTNITVAANTTPKSNSSPGLSSNLESTILRQPTPIHPVHWSGLHLSSSSNSTPISGSSSSTPDPLETTPELFDTGFYRHRVELAANSTRELINLSHSQRRAQKYRKEAMTAGPTVPIITLDGAVLTPNFNRVTQDCLQPETGDHAMSFMQYESFLPAYQSEWTGSSEAAG